VATKERKDHKSPVSIVFFLFPRGAGFDGNALGEAVVGQASSLSG
jgi:hypothetical protein